MIKLGVNIDHCATLRQARYRDISPTSKIIVEPDPIDLALLAERAGADSITAHLREDRRHIVDRDISELRKNLTTKLNLEMACTPEMLAIALKIKPDYVCIVPENRREVTTEGGLSIGRKKSDISRAVSALSKKGVDCSIFIDPDLEQVSLAQEVGAQTVELHTGAFANAWSNKMKKRLELFRIREAAEYALRLGLKVNAGHGINYLNIGDLTKLADFNEFNIGHSIISRALFCGIESAVKEMKELMNS